jgi:chemotaxis regulatin CheY-phosphate phosphatase CheZ
MLENNDNITSECKKFLKGLDPSKQAEITAQLFLEYCIYQDQFENIKRLAPLINTVAEALTKNIEGPDSLKLGIKAVQMYLRTPPVEYFGETISRLGFLDQESIAEMLQIQPNTVIFGTFLMEQGLITQEQRDISVLAQKRLFNIQEVYSRLLHQDTKENEADIAETLKGVFQHFLTSTAELEDDLRQSKTENIHDTLHRLENIIGETEKQTHAVLEIVDKVFTLKDELKSYTEAIKSHIDPSDKVTTDNIEKIFERLNFLFSLNLELNSTQQIQDRIGQQMLKIIPSIKTFHDQLLKIANKLGLNWKNVEIDQSDQTKVGYGGTQAKERAQQSDVDDLLSSLGL